MKEICVHNHLSEICQDDWCPFRVIYGACVFHTGVMSPLIYTYLLVDFTMFVLIYYYHYNGIVCVFGCGVGFVGGWVVEETSFICNMTQTHSLIFKCNGHLPTVLQDPFLWNSIFKIFPSKLTN